MGDQVQQETAVITADGSVQLPAASVIFGGGSASALSVWSLAGGSVDIRQGGQVLYRLEMPSGGAPLSCTHNLRAVLHCLDSALPCCWEQRPLT